MPIEGDGPDSQCIILVQGFVCILILTPIFSRDGALLWCEKPAGSCSKHPDALRREEQQPCSQLVLLGKAVC